MKNYKIEHKPKLKRKIIKHVAQGILLGILILLGLLAWMATK